MYIGKKLHGHCDGFFGIESHDDKIIEGIGMNWIVARDVVCGNVEFASFDTNQEMIDYIEKWNKRKNKNGNI